MRASTVTQYGVPMANGGRLCAFEIGNVRVLVEGPDSGENLFVADSLRAYWNADEAPEPGELRITSAADDVAALCARLLRGPVLSPTNGFSVGPWTPAVDDGYSWAVLDRNGTPYLLAHDAFEAALYFARLEDGTTDVGNVLIELPTDAELADRRRWDRWYEEHRFRGPVGDPNFVPPCPYDSQPEVR